MAEAIVICHDGSRRSVSCESLNCPGCGALVAPLYLYYEQMQGVLLCQCPVSNCKSLFLRKQYTGRRDFLPNHPLKSEVFGKTINTISPSFSKIYNEAFAAEQMGLMEICGVGYRKALEFLIKDYVMDGKEEDVQERIKQMLLGPCIETYVTDLNVKNVSKRAAWIGNDETHYVRKWENKDVQDLKGLIRLTIRWIEQEKETAALLLDMPDGK